MQLTLSKVHFSEALSDETNAFTADVHIDGVKVATAANQGTGGNTLVHAYGQPQASQEKQLAQIKDNQQVMDRYEKWAQTQPNAGIGKYTWAPEGLPRSLEADVDAAFEQWLTGHYAKQDQARMKRMCQKKWVFTLKEHNGQPTGPNAIFTLPRVPTQQMAVVKQQLQARYGENFKELLNEIYG